MQSFGNLFTWHLVLSFLNIGMVRGYCGPSGSGMPTQTQIDDCASGTSSSCAGLGCTWSDEAGGGTGGGPGDGPPGGMSGGPGGEGAAQAFCGPQDGTQNEACSAETTESDCGTVSGCSWQQPPEGGDEDPCLAFTEETACTSDATTTCFWDPNQPDSIFCSDTEQSGPAAVVCTTQTTYTLCNDKEACKTEGSGCGTSCETGTCALSSTCACIDKPAEVQEDTGPICMCCITKTCADITGQGGGSYEGCASSGPFLRQDTHECSDQAPGGCTVSECCTMSQADASQGMSQGMASGGPGGSGTGAAEQCGDKSDENTCTAVSTCSWCSDGGYCVTGQCGDGGGGGGGCDMSEDQDGWDPDGNACVCKGSNNQGNQGPGAKPYCSSFTGCNALIADAATTLCNYDYCQSNQCCDMDSNTSSSSTTNTTTTSSSSTNSPSPSLNTSGSSNPSPYAYWNTPSPFTNQNQNTSSSSFSPSPTTTETIFVKQSIIISGISASDFNSDPKVTAAFTTSIATSLGIDATKIYDVQAVGGRRRRHLLSGSVKVTYKVKVTNPAEAKQVTTKMKAVQPAAFVQSFQEQVVVVGGVSGVDFTSLTVTVEQPVTVVQSSNNVAGPSPSLFLLDTTTPSSSIDDGDEFIFNELSAGLSLHGIYRNRVVVMVVMLFFLGIIL